MFTYKCQLISYDNIYIYIYIMKIYEKFKKNAISILKIYENFNSNSYLFYYWVQIMNFFFF